MVFGAYIIMTEDTVTETPFHNYNFLSVYDRIWIMLGLGLVFLTAFCCMICKLWPGCFLHKYCPLRAKFDDEEKHVVVLPKKSTEDSLLRELSHTLWSTIHGHQPSSAKADDGIETVSVGSGPDEPGTLQCTIEYISDAESLQIRNIKITQLSGIKVSRPCNPCVKILLNKKKSKAHKRTSSTIPSEFNFQTQCRKSNLSPKFDDIFEASIKAKHVKNYVVHFLIFDCDKYSHVELVGEVMFFLKNLIFDKEEIMVQEIQEPVQEPTGRMLVSLSYLPTAERLSCVIMRIRNLTLAPEMQQDIALYVTANVLHGKDTVTKQRTSIRHGEINPTFNETLTFDIPVATLGMNTLILSLMYAVDKEQKSRSDIVIGKIYLGSQCEQSAKLHWTEMMQAPRKAVAYWHDMK